MGLYASWRLREGGAELSWEKDGKVGSCGEPKADGGAGWKGLPMRSCDGKSGV